MRQAFPDFAVQASRRIEGIRWSEIVPASRELGARSRLAVFLQVASGASPPAAWKQLRRTPNPRGPVFVLEPATVADQLVPGLWLDERAIISGSSAAQLAYAHAVAPHAVGGSLDHLVIPGTAPVDQGRNRVDPADCGHETAVIEGGA